MELNLLFRRDVKAWLVKRTFTLVLIIMFLFLTGCTFATSKMGTDNLTKPRNAISNQAYKLASQHARLVLKNEPGNREAHIILTYLDYGDNILLAAYWENDTEAIRYIAPIVYDINREDPQFKAPVLVLAAAWGHTDIS